MRGYFEASGVRPLPMAVSLTSIQEFRFYPGKSALCLVFIAEIHVGGYLEGRHKE